MRYTCLKIEIPEGDQRDIVLAEITEFNIEGIEETKNEIIVYFRNEEHEVQSPGIIALLNGHGLKYHSGPVQEVNWNEEWESNFPPVEVCGRFYIRAPFHEPSGYEHEVVIMPKMSFGTGHHSTTWLMISAMLDMDMSGKKILDVGSGTGILAIAALKMGASHADAVDIEQWAYENGLENGRDNEVSGKMNVYLGTIGDIKGTGYDLVLANISRNVLLSEIHSYSKKLAAGGELLLSGFLSTDSEYIKEEAYRNGLTFVSGKEKEGWCSLLFRLNSNTVER